LTIRNDGAVRADGGSATIRMSVRYRLLDADGLVMSTGTEIVRGTSIGESGVSGGVLNTRIRNSVRLEFTGTDNL
jgi:hypothetical protein